ncbi:Late competence protein ComGE [Staphylococcus aureus]|uniref:Late competence protein ComGE n=1 Tax=Staphylococcus aureus TaxID=1280 RepID=A0A380EI93_STAAU|nr:Late competence protein ComGE [Staphylococcus aureus]
MKSYKCKGSFLIDSMAGFFANWIDYITIDTNDESNASEYKP